MGTRGEHAMNTRGTRGEHAENTLGTCGKTRGEHAGNAFGKGGEHAGNTLQGAPNYKQKCVPRSSYYANTVGESPPSFITSPPFDASFLKSRR